LRYCRWCDRWKPASAFHTDRPRAQCRSCVWLRRKRAFRAQGRSTTRQPSPVAEISLARAQRNERLLTFIRWSWKEFGEAPTHREMMLVIKGSWCVVSWSLADLEREGRIRRRPGVARGIVAVA
jgi:hypothetical protein